MFLIDFRFDAFNSFMLMSVTVVPRLYTPPIKRLWVYKRGIAKNIFYILYVFEKIAIK